MLNENLTTVHAVLDAEIAGIDEQETPADGAQDAPWNSDDLGMGPFYHGGTPGLIAGDRLTPHPELAHSLASERLWTLSRDPQRNEHVFFTDHLPWALLYAQWHAERHQKGTVGAVYEVTPEGPIERDNSEQLVLNLFGLQNGTVIPALCYRARAATVLRTAAWSDGTNWYDAAGTVICGPAAR